MQWLPAVALSGENLVKPPADPRLAAWWKGPTLAQVGCGRGLCAHGCQRPRDFHRWFLWRCCREGSSSRCSDGSGVQAGAGVMRMGVWFRIPCQGCM